MLIRCLGDSRCSALGWGDSPMGAVIAVFALAISVIALGLFLIAEAVVNFHKQMTSWDVRELVCGMVVTTSGIVNIILILR